MYIAQVIQLLAASFDFNNNDNNNNNKHCTPPLASNQIMLSKYHYFKF